MRLSKIISILIVCIIIGVAGVYFGFNVTSDGKRPHIQNKIIIEEPEVSNDIELVIPKPEEKKITENTKLIYQYYHTVDGKIDITEEDAPYFLLNKTKSDIEELFNEWEIISFESDKVIMRKIIEGKSNQYYIIGVSDGYVAVYYKNEVNGNNLKEVTDTPVSPLPLEIQENLLKGIEVIGEDNLMRVLEDYGS